MAPAQQGSLGRGGAQGAPRQAGGPRKRVAAGPLGDVKLHIGRLKRLLEQVCRRSLPAAAACPVYQPSR
jgi:hypothetical protein